MAGRCCSTASRSTAGAATRRPTRRVRAGRSRMACCVSIPRRARTPRARDIISKETYDQFELTWDWRAAPGANSGVKYFVLEDQDAAIGHEYQVIDDERHADAKIGPHRQTAAFYDVLPAANRPIKPAGEWNQSRVVVKGTAVEHWLNGTKVLSYTLEIGRASCRERGEKQVVQRG